MGYTHYWKKRRDIVSTAWHSILEDTQRILTAAQRAGIPLGDGGGEAGTAPTYGSNAITLNGIGKDSHETFHLVREAQGADRQQDGYDFTFCKTAQKPYDAVVTAILVVAAQYTASKDFIVSSDGNYEDFEAGIKLCEAAGIRISQRTKNKLIGWLGSSTLAPEVTTKPKQPMRRKALW